MAHGRRRQAHVPGAGSARWRALHAAGGHGCRPDQEGRLLCRRPAQLAARQEHPPRRRLAQRQHRRDPRARRSHAHGRAQPGLRPVPRSGGHLRAGWRRLQAAGLHQARSPAQGAGAGAQAEHRHPAQPYQRAGRGRARDPAAGPGPHHRATARRAGHGQGQGHPGSHGHAGSAPGRRILRARGAELVRAPCPSAPSDTWTATLRP